MCAVSVEFREKGACYFTLVEGDSFLLVDFPNKQSEFSPRLSKMVYGLFDGAAEDFLIKLGHFSANYNLAVT